MPPEALPRERLGLAEESVRPQLWWEHLFADDGLLRIPLPPRPHLVCALSGGAQAPQPKEPLFELWALRSHSLVKR